MTQDERDTKRWLQITNTILRGFLGSGHYVELWWQSPNLAFRSLTPIEQWEIDRQVVTEYVMNRSNYP